MKIVVGDKEGNFVEEVRLHHHAVHQGTAQDFSLRHVTINSKSVHAAWFETEYILHIL